MGKFIKILLYATVITPTFLFYGVLFPYIGSKIFPFEALILLASIFWLYLWAKKPDQYAPRISMLAIAVGSYIAATIIASLQGLNFWKSFWSVFERLDGIFIWIILLMFFLMLSVFMKKKEDWTRLLGLSLSVSTIIGLRAVDFFGVFNGKLLFPQSVAGAFGSTIFLAIYSLFHIGISLILLSWQSSQIKSSKQSSWVRKHGWTVCYAIGFFTNLLALLATFSRGPIIGFISGSVIFFILYGVYGAKGKLTGKVLGGMALSILLFALFLWYTGLVTRLGSVFQGLNADETRAINWGVAVNVFEARPLLGWGSNSYFNAQNDFYNPRLAFLTKESFDRVHNKYLEIAVESGIIGILAYAAIFVTAFFCLARARKEKPFLFSLLSGILAAYLIQNITAFDNPGSYLPLFLILAFINQEFSPKETFLLKLNTPAFAVGVLVIIIFLWQGVWEPFMANLALASALSQESYPNKDYNTILDDYKEALSYQSMGDYEARLRLGLLLANEQQMTSDLLNFGIKELERESEISSHEALIKILLAKAYEKKAAADHNADFVKKAGEKFQEAIALAPKRIDAYEHYALFLLNQKKSKEAREALFKIKGFSEDIFNSEEKQWYIGLSYYIENDFKSAHDIFQGVLKRGGHLNSDQQLLVLAQTAYEVKKYDEMVTWYETLIKVEKNSNNIEYRRFLAAAYAKVGKKDLAIDQARYAEKLDPSITADVENFIKSLK